MGKSQRIRDPLHNLIVFRDNDVFEQALWQIVQTPSFQRLRRIKQLGFSDFVYPGATHSRFAHSLGTFHIARQFSEILARLLPSQTTSSWDRPAQAAALIHDIGHGPFSHAFEDVGKRLNLSIASHEEMTATLIAEGEIGQILEQEGIKTNVIQLIKSPPKNEIFGSIVSSQFDADRLDYMQRDRLMTGTQTGSVDLTWLMSNLEIGEAPYGIGEQKLGTMKTFVLGPKAIHAAEAYILGLFQLYPTVYFHKTTRGVEKLFTELLVRIIELAQHKKIINIGLPAKHPLITFAKNPASPEQAQKLDDTVILGALPLLEEAKDPLISAFARRIRRRNLFKCIDIREQLRKKFPETEPLSIAQENTKSQLEQWIQQHPSPLPRLLLDEGKREPYKRFQDDKGPMNQIQIRNNENKIVDISTCSDIVKSMQAFQFFRAYIAEDDADARSAVESAIANARI